MIQLQVLNKVLEERSTALLDSNGIGPEYFSEYFDEYSYIIHHNQRYGNVPDDESMLEHFPGFQLLTVTEPELYLIEQIREEYMYNEMVPILQRAAEEMQTDTNLAVTNLVPQVVKLVEQSKFIGGVDIAKESHKRLEWANEIKNHEGDLLGIPTGFELLDDIFGGMLPGEDLIVIVGRPGDGKSWTIDKMISNAWKLGHSCLLYSGEMSEFQVGARIDTLVSNISINSITKGIWNDNMFSKYEDHIQQMSESGVPLNVVTPFMLGGRKMSPALLDSMIQKYKPEVVGIDQLSLMSESVPSREDKRIKYANISAELYQLSAKYEIPILLNVQANRNVTQRQEKAILLEDIAESDGVGQNASRVVTMERDEVNNILWLNIQKNRYGEDNKVIEYFWNLETGEYKLTGFRQFDEEGEGYYEREEEPNELQKKANRIHRQTQQAVRREGVEAF